MIYKEKFERIVRLIVVVICMTVGSIILWVKAIEPENLFFLLGILWVVFFDLTLMPLFLIIGYFISAFVLGVIQSTYHEFYLLQNYFEGNWDKNDKNKTKEPAKLRLSGMWALALANLLPATWQTMFSSGAQYKNEESYIPKFRIVQKVAYITASFLLAVFFSIVLVALIILSTPYIIAYYIVWLLDFMYLFIHKITQPCGNCHARNLRLNYECPECGAVHEYLVPNSYGILTHRCVCGRKMPSTFFNGRSSVLKASCPKCGAYVSGAGTRPFTVQLIGGSNAGKTVFVSAFYHLLFDKINEEADADYIVDKNEKALFSDLKDWYEGVPCESTRKMNSTMYSIQICSKQLDVARKFSIYDIAGEMFNCGKAEMEITQKQFQYCNGIVFILDPFSNYEYRNSLLDSGEILPQYSDAESRDVINAFLDYLSKTGKRVGAVCQMPFSVVITKADVKAIRQKLNMVKIKAEYTKRAKDSDVELSEVRDNMCKDFLCGIGLGELVSIIETRFTNVHFFLASPIGHEPNGEQFEAWGVVEPVEWIVKEQDEKLYNVLFGGYKSKRKFTL